MPLPDFRSIEADQIGEASNLNQLNAKTIYDGQLLNKLARFRLEVFRSKNQNINQTMPPR